MIVRTLHLLRGTRLWLTRRLDHTFLSGVWQRLLWRMRYQLALDEHALGFDALLARPHRDMLVAELGRFPAISSLLEVGCGRGVNLYRIAERYPGIVLAGLDVSRAAVRVARRELATRGLRGVTLHVGDITSMEMFRDGQFDVVLADAVLMYLPPKEIGRAIGEMLRVARYGLLLSAWHVDRAEGMTPWIYDEGTWIYDYRHVMQSCCQAHVTVRRYPDNAWTDARWRKWGSMIHVLHMPRLPEEKYGGSETNDEKLSQKCFSRIVTHAS